MNEPANTQQQTDGSSTASAPQFDPAALKSAITEAFSEASQNQPQQQQQFTPEELDQHLGVWHPNQEFVARWNGRNAEGATPEQQLAPFKDLTQGMRGEFRKYADLLVDYKIQQVLQQLQPLMGHYQQTVQTQHEENFYKEYPELNDFKEIVNAAAIPLKQQLNGKKTDVKELRKLLAEASAKVVAKFRPDFKLGARSEQPAVNPGGMPPMTPTSSGSSSGGMAKPSTTGSGIW